MNRLLIDGQVFQTPALHRGMGKYSNELIAALIEANRTNKQWDEIEVVYSQHFEPAEQFVDELGQWTDAVSFTELDLLPNEPGNSRVTDHNRSAIDAYLAQTSGNDGVDFLILALFQSQICSVYPSAASRRLLLMHDLIPLTFQEVYLKDEVIRQEYATKLSECFKADAYFTVSQTVANDMALYLGIDASRLFHIDGGPIHHAPHNKKYSVEQPFILMPTGNDVRKNNHRGIVGFEKFNQAAGGNYKLVITSLFLDHEIQELSQLSPNVLFAGNVSGAELNYLYEHCAALLFPTEDEGLGLPILEALERDRPIACSDISVFREMSSTAFHFFDPSDAQAMADSLQRAIDSPVDHAAYHKVLQNFSWPAVAQRLLTSMKSISPRDMRAQPAVRMYAPSPALSSPAGWFARMLSAELGKLAQLSAATPEASASSNIRLNFLPYLYPLAHIDNLFFDPISEAAPLYILDDSPESAVVLCRALAVPGVVVLLDIDLRPVWDAALGQGLLSQERYDLEQSIDDYVKVPIGLGSLLSRQLAVITLNPKHAKKAESVVSGLGSGTEAVQATVPYIAPPYPNVFPEKSIEHMDLDGLSEIERHRYEQLLRCEDVRGLGTGSRAFPDKIVLDAAHHPSGKHGGSTFAQLAKQITELTTKKER